MDALHNMFKLKRISDKPILKPDHNLFWENEGVFNAGVIQFEDSIYMLYRAVGEKDAYISHLGLAKSSDGILFQREGNMPVFGPSKEYDLWGTEDPRITKIDNEYYITYVAVPERIMDHGQGMKRDIPLMTSTALLKTKDFKTFEHLGVITPLGSDNKDVVLFPKKIPHIDEHGKSTLRYAMLHRPNRWSQDWLKGPFGSRVVVDIPLPLEKMPHKPSIWIAWSDDLITWDSHKPFMVPGDINSAKNGPGLPPIETADGWLVIYHHVNENQATKKLTYTTRAALFDLNDPTVYVAKLGYDILTPEVAFETENGAAIVFPTGGFIKDDVLYVYYGCSDTYVGLATGSVSELITELKRIGPPKTS